MPKLIRFDRFHRPSGLVGCLVLLALTASPAPAQGLGKGNDPPANAQLIADAQRFLRDHPGFLRAHPELARLSPAAFEAVMRRFLMDHPQFLTLANTAVRPDGPIAGPPASGPRAKAPNTPPIPPMPPSPAAPTGLSTGLQGAGQALRMGIGTNVTGWVHSGIRGTQLADLILQLLASRRAASTQGPSSAPAGGGAPAIPGGVNRPAHSPGRNPTLPQMPGAIPAKGKENRPGGNRPGGMPGGVGGAAGGVAGGIAGGLDQLRRGGPPWARSGQVADAGPGKAGLGANPAPAGPGPANGQPPLTQKGPKGFAPVPGGPGGPGMIGKGKGGAWAARPDHPAGMIGKGGMGKGGPGKAPPAGPAIIGKGGMGKGGPGKAPPAGPAIIGKGGMGKGGPGKAPPAGPAIIGKGGMGKGGPGKAPPAGPAIIGKGGAFMPKGKGR